MFMFLSSGVCEWDVVQEAPARQVVHAVVACATIMDCLRESLCIRLAKLFVGREPFGWAIAIVLGGTLRDIAFVDVGGTGGDIVKSTHRLSENNEPFLLPVFPMISHATVPAQCPYSARTVPTTVPTTVPNCKNTQFL